MFKLNHIIFFLSCLLLIFGCKPTEITDSDNIANSDADSTLNMDTLRAGTIIGPTTYFDYRDEVMGYDYELVQNLSDSLHVPVKFIVASTENELIELLKNKEIDLIAHSIYKTKTLKKKFQFVVPHPESFMVLIQNLSAKSITDITELKGKKITVHSNSIFEDRLNKLNKQTDGKILIDVAPDSVSYYNLIEMVANGKIDYTLAYFNTALLYKSFYKRLDIRMQIGYDQSNGWLVRNDDSTLLKEIQKWQQLAETENLQSVLYAKYQIRSPFFALRKMKIPRGDISPYDKIFKKYAPEIGWDWRLLASVAFHESNFDSSQVSIRGASGLMQLMPRTAANFGLDEFSILNPEKNIEAGVQYIKSLNLSFRKIQNKEERVKFILAAYNSGPAHIFDAMALADKYGKDSHVWFDNVEFFLLKKNIPEFYNDEVVKFGQFRGKQTVSYVKVTLNTFQKYLSK